MTEFKPGQLARFNKNITGHSYGQRDWHIPGRIVRIVSIKRGEGTGEEEYAIIADLNGNKITKRSSSYVSLERFEPL
jgi:hypothetical protein